MRILRRIVVIIVILVLVLGAVGAGGVFYLVRRPFPQIDGTLRLAGLDSPVTIIRDQRGIPHIYARSARDLFFAQGFVHAQDRLWQMESTRRGAAGRTSELLPTKSAIEADKIARTIGLRRAAEADYAAMNEADKAVVQAYADGVNAYLTVLGSNLPIEFVIAGAFGSKGLNYSPEPWSQIDSMQWAKAMAYDQSGSFRRDLFFAQVLAKFGENAGVKALAAISPPYDESLRPLIIPPGVAWERVPTGLAGWSAIDSIGGGGGLDAGSNSWVVAGSRTTTGKPLLANDPHIGLQLPAIWYFNSLHCEPVGPDCPYNVIGASLLGVPGVVIGHNARIAWGLTNSAADTRDLFLEKITGSQYEYRGKMVDLEIIPETLTIKGKLPADYQPSANETSTYDEASNTTTITLNIRKTRHGPIISDVEKLSSDLYEYDVAYAWTGNSAPEGLVSAVLALDRAQNWEDLRAGVSLAGTPSLNVVYADVDGNIGYQFFGRIPIRASGNGQVPMPGWTGEYDWVGYIPTDELPSVLNPDEGYLVTANNAVVDSTYPYLLSLDYDRGYRAQRIVDRIESKQQISPDDMASIQGDSYNLAAESIAPYLDGLTVEGDAQKVLDAIRGWDFVNARDRAGATAFETFLLYLVRNTFGDELGDLARAYASLSGGGGFERWAISRLLEAGGAEWWDDVGTADRQETREDILKKSLADAASALTTQLGGDPAGWTWGKVHFALFKSQALGDSPVAFLFNRGPFEVDGGWAIVNNTGGDAGQAYPNPDRPSDPPGKLADAFRERQSPSLRQVVDLGDLNASRFIHTVGQSGLPYHPHYQDLVDLWRNIQYAPMWWNRVDVEGNAEGTLNLTP